MMDLYFGSENVFDGSVFWNIHVFVVSLMDLCFVVLEHAFVFSICILIFRICSVFWIWVWVWI